MSGSGSPGVFGSEEGGDVTVGWSQLSWESMTLSFVLAGTFEVEGELEKFMIFEGSCAGVICRRKGEDGAMAGLLYVLSSGRHDLVLDPSGWIPR